MSLPSPPPQSPDSRPETPLYRDPLGTIYNAFGVFRGKEVNGVYQYLGIRYAQLTTQLSAPDMVSFYDGVVDCTEYGPRAPAIDASLFEQEVMIQKVLDGTPPPEMSGTQCLNLNVTVPDVEVGTKLPVLVWIHGGGYIMGGNYLPHWDPVRLVKMSVECGTPVVVVSVNYRLGLLGNLTSAELRVKNYPGNNSLRDQRCALQWVKMHISGFGGDPEKITAIGVSAGAVSILTHLFSTAPLFNRAIAMSGTPLMLKPLTLGEAEKAYEQVISALGLEKATVEERIHYLLRMTPEELVAKTPAAAQLSPFVDGALIPEALTFESFSSNPDASIYQMFGINQPDPLSPSYSSSTHRRLKTDINLPGSKWCKDLLIGDCQTDGTVFTLMGLSSLRQNLASTLYTSFTRTLDPHSATKILTAYNIYPDTHDDAAFTSAIHLGTDIAYYAPAVTYAGCYPGTTYLYHFNEGNPFPGVFEGLASHYLDAVYLFQNYNAYLSTEGRHMARLMGRQFLGFACGSAPWGFYRRGDEWKWHVGVYGDEVGGGRRNAVGECMVGGVRLEGWSRAWEGVLKGN